jgi:hypothetical protein
MERGLEGEEERTRGWKYLLGEDWNCSLPTGATEASTGHNDSGR